MPITPERLKSCLETLEAIGALDPAAPEVALVERAVARIAKSAKKRRRAERRQRARAADRRIVDEKLPVALSQERLCTVCKRGYRIVHVAYAHHCPACGDVDAMKRAQRADLSGRRALVTGGRIKIGHRLALKMLRDGAHVGITTRFPADARARFEAEADARTWLPRLTIHPLHLGDLRSVLELTARLCADQPHLDILVNNASQTVRRAPAYYAEWAQREEAPGVPPALAAFYARSRRAAALLGPAAGVPSGAVVRADWFPHGLLDEEGLPLDLSRTNSWKLLADDVSPEELVEVMVVNTIAPFLLTTGLSALLRRSPYPDRYVVQATAVEGQFEVARKTARHPHTNMAKAALNMLTRTAAASYAEDGIYMTSVDTGWVTNENPQHERDSQRARGFRAPLDVEDGAARLYDPIVRGVLGTRLFGVLLKDYAPVPW